jgi:hypothetical protein
MNVRLTWSPDGYIFMRLFPMLPSGAPLPVNGEEATIMAGVGEISRAKTHPSGDGLAGPFDRAALCANGSATFFRVALFGTESWVPLLMTAKVPVADLGFADVAELCKATAGPETAKAPAADLSGAFQVSAIVDSSYPGRAIELEFRLDKPESGPLTFSVRPSAKDGEPLLTEGATARIIVAGLGAGAAQPEPNFPFGALTGPVEKDVVCANSAATSVSVAISRQGATQMDPTEVHLAALGIPDAAALCAVLSRN